MPSNRKISFHILLTVGLAMGGLPANADLQEVKRTEKEVKEFEAKFGFAFSASQFARLAFLYLQNDMEKQAFASFNRAVAAEAKGGALPTTLPGIYMDWAMQLAKYGLKKKSQEYLKYAKLSALDGLKIANQSSNDSNQFLWYQFRMVEFFNTAKMTVDEQAQIKRLDKQLLRMEINPSLGDVEAIMAAETLEKMSNFYVPSVGFLNSETTTVLKIIADKTPTAPNTVKESDYSRAECYQLRAKQQYSKLPDNNLTRINAQRRLALWYRFLGQKQKEEIQTHELAKLMGTNDRALLFPGFRQCLGCGMG